MKSGVNSSTVLHKKVHCYWQQVPLIISWVSFFFSQTFHDVISFLYSFVTKMQEGDYDAEPKEESKVW